jgi:hypothetical protein
MRKKRIATGILVLLTIATVAAGCEGMSAADNIEWGGSSTDNIESGSTVDWETAVGIVNSGDVDSVVQAHNLDVTLELGDGRAIYTTEPGIDDIFDVISNCGGPCSSIAIATE